ncbi:DUF3617 domain-containing protein [Marinimicrobium sp. ABcell2]|uniref:DUF3617 domain-containing protein n=1 Tax=Marinimicrobium sp. ABcell2 TaxID=3069751 RepID=UPI0027B7A9EB|nr:DUF3617 domain-containing protein [Marinimicrobium sp. ABcell2]MDQ2075100.1 DUF3617 domain-containing protein [Marinimicrobium sp. ABcell2]
MKTIKYLSLGVGLAFASGPLFANEFPNIKPGLWEHKVEMESEGGELEEAMAEARQQMEQQMADMPPAQREMMEQMMEEQGMSFDLSDQRFESCVTEEQAQAGEFDIADEDCDQNIITQSDERIEMEFACPDGERGRGEMVMHSDEHYTGDFQLETDMEGKPVTLNLRQEGRWLQEDC